jgi:NADH:ubiquinone oxidoreductase subunit K
MKAKNLLDLLFSYVFVFLSVTVAGLGIKDFSVSKFQGIFFLLLSVWLFGIGCMGLNRLNNYLYGECNSASVKRS